VREGLKSLIKEEQALEVVGEAADVTEGLRLARRHQPEVIVLDNEMPIRSGLDALPQFRAEAPGARIVMFSLDTSAREPALAAGAHAFVTKDAPLHEILASLKPRRSGPPPQTFNVTIPRIPDVRHVRRAVVVIAIALLAYVGIFLIAERIIGAAAGVFSSLPVLVIGGVLGPEAGLVGAALSVGVTYGLWAATGHAIGEPVVLLGQGSGAVMLLLLGFSAGTLRLMSVRLAPRRRRAEALAEAVRALAGLDRPDLIDAFLEATLRVVRGERALLFVNAAGDARLVASSRGSGPAYPDRIAPLVREVRRAATPRAVDSLSDDQRFSPDTRSAAFVPVSAAGQDVRGVLVLLRRERTFDADEISFMRPFAQYLWLVLRASPIPATVAARTETEEQPV
jgi:CheY-like chemotaxis protein